MCEGVTFVAIFTLFQEIFLNIPKSEAWWPSGSLKNQNLFPSDIKIVEVGTEMLGVPVGNTGFCQEFFENKLTKVTDLLQRVDDLEDTQVSFMLISKCVAFCRFAFFARSSVNSATIDAFNDFDKMIRHALDQLLAGTGITDQQWTQARLSLKSGGLGLRSVYKHRYAAILASYASCSKLVTTVTKDLTEEDFFRRMKMSEHIRCYNSQVDPADAVTIGCIGKQKELSEKINRKELLELTQPMDTVNKARMTCITGPLSSGWLNAVPHSSNTMTSNEFRSLIKLRLGIPLYDTTLACDQCGTALDNFGIHAITCRIL